MPETGEGTTEGTTESTTESEAPATGEEQLGDAGKQALDRMKVERNDAARRARDLEKQLNALREASMSEAEKAVSEAEARGRSAAAADFGKRLVKSELAAAAARRNPDYDTAGLDYLDLGRFVSDDGEPDAKAISAAVERLVPAPAGAPSFDGGARGTAPKTGDMNSIIRKAAGLG